eukprot:4828938-Amphidinium_carterae.1
MERTKEKVMEESLRGRHYHTTSGKERTVEKEKETRTSFATTVANQAIRATNVGGTRKDKCTTWISLRRC